MPRKKNWTKQEYVHRALGLILAKMFKKANEPTLPATGELLLKLLEILDDDRTSRVDSMEDQVSDLAASVNLIKSSGILETT